MLPSNATTVPNRSETPSRERSGSEEPPPAQSSGHSKRRSLESVDATRDGSPLPDPFDHARVSPGTATIIAGFREEIFRLSKELAAEKESSARLARQTDYLEWENSSLHQSLAQIAAGTPQDLDLLTNQMKDHKLLRLRADYSLNIDGSLRNGTHNLVVMPASPAGPVHN